MGGLGACGSFVEVVKVVVAVEIMGPALSCSVTAAGVVDDRGLVGLDLDLSLLSCGRDAHRGRICAVGEFCVSELPFVELVGTAVDWASLS